MLMTQGLLVNYDIEQNFVKSRGGKQEAWGIIWMIDPDQGCRGILQAPGVLPLVFYFPYQLNIG